MHRSIAATIRACTSFLASHETPKSKLSTLLHQFQHNYLVRSEYYKSLPNTIFGKTLWLNEKLSPFERTVITETDFSRLQSEHALCIHGTPNVTPFLQQLENNNYIISKHGGFFVTTDPREANTYTVTNPIHPGFIITNTKPGICHCQLHGKSFYPENSSVEVLAVIQKQYTIRSNAIPLTAFIESLHKIFTSNAQN